MAGQPATFCMYEHLITVINEQLTQADGKINGKLLLSPRYSSFVSELEAATAVLGADYSPRARVAFVLEQRVDPPVCLTCGKLTKYSKQTQSFSSFCNAKCAQTNSAVRGKAEATNLARYGVRHAIMASDVIEKQKETNIKRYGVEKPFQSAEIQRKVVNTVASLGVSSTALLPCVAEKQKETNIKRYGVEKPFQSAEIQRKVTTAHTEAHGVSRHSMLHIPVESREFLASLDSMYEAHCVHQQSLTEIAEHLGCSDVTVGKHLHQHGLDTLHFQTSYGEQQLATFLAQLGIECSRNRRDIIPPKELDIFIPSHNIAIEYCGLYWHGERQGKHRSYHREKYERCKDKGIRLITLYDWEWNTKRTIVQDKLRSILGKGGPSVYARECEVRDVSTAIKKQFFNQHHIQGSGPGSVTHGLYHNDVLVAAMTWIITNDECVLNRYATSAPTVGGFTKLLTHFKRTAEWDTIVSFADLRWSSGDLYTRTGFTLDNELPPDYTYIINGEPKHKFAFRHASLRNRLQQYDSSLSEWENMKKHGFDRVWDCGKLRFVMARSR